MRESDELAGVRRAVRPCHQLQNGIGGNSELVPFKGCLRFNMISCAAWIVSDPCLIARTKMLRNSERDNNGAIQ
jgi:hypothetical protein